MDKVEDRIKSNFIKLLKKQEIDTIDVSSLSLATKITRQAFYYHYKDIDDLIFSIYMDEEFNNKNLSSIEGIIDDLLTFLFNKETFNKEVANSKYSYVLSDITYYFIFRSLSLYLNKFNDSFKGSEKDIKKILSRFLANAINEETLTLFIEKTNTKEKIQRELCALIDDNLIKYLISNLKGV